MQNIDDGSKGEPDRLKEPSRQKLSSKQAIILAVGALGVVLGVSSVVTKVLHQDEEAQKDHQLLDHNDIENLDLRLRPFKALYDSLNEESKQKVTWKIARKRLIENNGFNLKAAEALNECVIFGVDSKGRLLFADGLQYITDMKEFTNLTFEEARDKVYYVRNEDGENIRTGHELFPREDGKGTMRRLFEDFTRRRFIEHRPDEHSCESWVINIDDSYPIPITSNMTRGRILHVGYRIPFEPASYRSVRRLLRV